MTIENRLKGAVVFPFAQLVENTQQPECTGRRNIPGGVWPPESWATLFNTAKDYTKMCFWIHLRLQIGNAVTQSWLPHSLYESFSLGWCKVNYVCSSSHNNQNVLTSYRRVRVRVEWFKVKTLIYIIIFKMCLLVFYFHGTCTSTFWVCQRCNDFNQGLLAAKLIQTMSNAWLNPGSNVLFVYPCFLQVRGVSLKYT